MANQLRMAMVEAIIALLDRGWSYRRIARELGVHRETVARYARLRRQEPAKPAKVTPGSESDDSPEPAKVTPGARPPESRSRCAEHAEWIQDKLDGGLSAQRIFQDLVIEKGFAGSYSSVKRYVRRLGAATPLPFRRMECRPGEEVQVDFGAGPWVVEDGRKRRTHVLRITLSHSREGYSEAIFRQTVNVGLLCPQNVGLRCPLFVGFNLLL